MTTQQTHPHPELATARNSLMEALGIDRKSACGICDSMNTEQVQGVLDANGDREKIDAVILSMKPQQKSEKSENKQKSEKSENK